MSPVHEQHIRPGAWESPITAELLSRQSVKFSELHVDPETGAIYVVEERPSESGRCCIIQHINSEARDILPSPYSARSRVHEYGGAACSFSSTGILIFTDWDTNGIFALDLSSGHITIVTDAKPGIFYADFGVHPNTPGLVLAVQEDRTVSPIQNTIAMINTSTGTISVLLQGADFYAHPRFNHDGSKISWTQWNHPDMPWNGTELYTASWHAEGFTHLTKVAGAAGIESICQPRWGPSGTLFFISDRSNYWQLYRLEPDSSVPTKIRLDGLENVEFGERENWLGNCTYVCLTENLLVASYFREGANAVILIQLDTNTFVTLPLGLVDIQRSAIKRSSDTSFAIIGSSMTSPQSLYTVDIANPWSKKLIRSSTTVSFPDLLYSPPQHISFPRIYGASGGFAHAIYLPPHNPAYQVRPGVKPPLILSLHGGPTSHTTLGLCLETQYYTSRGYAYVHVNYAGSTGYGRAYRDILKASWGVIDVVDAVSCVAYLSSLSYIDPARVGIRGSSAGGYTALQALCVYPSIWAAGVSYYGIGNLASLSKIMHKFESHYISQCLFQDGLSKLDLEEIYMTRSPCYNASKIKAPVLLLQGSNDAVVPSSQAVEMARTMRENGRASKLVLFAGEGHGFQNAVNLEAAIQQEADWWARTLLR